MTEGWEREWDNYVGEGRMGRWKECGERGFSIERMEEG